MRAAVVPDGEHGGASTRRVGLAVTAVGLFLATFVYLYAFRNEGLFHLDVVFLAQAVEQLYAGGRWDMGWRFGAVLANAVVYLPFWLMGESAERSTILASILFHAASIPMVFLFLDRLCGIRLVAALSAGLLALAPVYAIANTFGKEYGLALLLVATAFLLALRARDTGGVAGAAASALCFALSFIVWEGAMALTPIYAIVLVVPRFALPAWDARTLRVWGAALAGFAVGLAFDLSTSLASIVATTLGTPTMTQSLGFPSPQLRVAVDDLARLLGWPFLVGSAGGVVVAVRRPRYRALLPLAVPLVATLLFYGNLSTYGPRYLVFCALGLSMLAGAAVHAMLTSERLLQVAGTMSYLAMIAWMVAVSHPLLAPRHTYNGAKRYAQLIAEVTEPESVIIVMDDRRFVEYYARRRTLQHPIGDPAATAAWVETVRRAMEQGPVYLAESGLTYDPGRIVRRAIDENFTATVVGTRLSEDFHNAEGRRQVYEGHLWRLAPR